MSQEPNAGGFVNINGNAATATKLQTPRLINNTKFDGAADIRILDLTGATGADGKKLPTQTVLTRTTMSLDVDVSHSKTTLGSVQTDLTNLKASWDKGVDSVRTDLSNLSTNFDTSTQSVTTDFDNLKSTSTTALNELSNVVSNLGTNTKSKLSSLEAKLTKAATDADNEIVHINSKATDVRATVDAHHQQEEYQLSNALFEVSHFIPKDVTRRAELSFRPGTYRVNSTGRPIHLMITCATQTLDSLFLLQINSKSPIPGAQDIVTDIFRMTRTSELKQGYMEAIIPPNVWWSIKWVQSGMTDDSGSAVVMSLQNRNDFRALRHYYDGRTQFMIDADGSEDHYKGPNWVPMK